MLTKYMFGGRDEGPFVKLISGSMAGATSVICTYPLDIMRARLAYKIHLHNSLQDVHEGGHSPRLSLRGILFGAHGSQMSSRDDGWKLTFRSIVNPTRRWHGENSTNFVSKIRLLYRGFTPSVLGIIPYAGVSFCTFETLKAFLVSTFNFSGDNKAGAGSDALSVPLKFICGFVAGICGQTAAYPLDVVRRRMQVDSIALHIPVYSSVWSALKDIYACQGARGLYIGISINYLKVAPATAISFVTYEFLKDKLHLAEAI